MTVVKPQRITATEQRYVPAFFQHGTKVLTPVHGYGYCSDSKKDYIQNDKEIHLPHLKVDDMFQVGQRVGVCVNHCTWDPAHGQVENYWSDGTILLVDKTSSMIRVRIDTPIGISYGGDSEIDFIDYIEGEAITSYAHLWQTVDGKSYVTANDLDIARSTTIYNPATILNGENIVLASSLDRYILSEPLCTTKYFPLKIFDETTVANAAYYQPIGEEWVTYEASQSIDLNVSDAYAPMFWDRLGHTDGSIIKKINADNKKTWFKDRPFLFRIRGEAIPGDEQLQTDPTFQPATIVYISNPFNVDHTANSKRFCLSVPSTSNDIPLPVDSNFWCTGMIDADETAFVCEFRPDVDENGMPFITNIGNNTIIDTSGDETICVYAASDVVDEKFLGCCFDVFRSVPENENDTYIGGQTTTDLFLCDIGTTPSTLEDIFKYGTRDTLSVNMRLATYPVMLSKVNMVESTAPNYYTRSVGSWDDVEYFNGKLWFVSGNVLKPTNALLEFDPVDTIEIPSSIVGVKALANQLFIMATDGIWTVNLKNELEFLSSIRANRWASVGESLYIVDERGQIFNTEFTPIPASDQRRITENPYMVLSLNTAMIQDVADQWNIFDIASACDMLWVASNVGLWAMESSTKAWFKVSNDVFVQLVNCDNEIFGVNGQMPVDKEQAGSDMFPLMAAEWPLTQE